MPDHVHVVASIPPAIAISTLVGRMKGASSHLLNNVVGSEVDATFTWQSEYSVLSFGERALGDVVAYANNQPARHAAQKLWAALEETDP
jgi:putative transposase